MKSIVSKERMIVRKTWILEERKKRGQTGKRDDVEEDFLRNSTSSDTYTEYVTKIKFNGDSASTSKLYGIEDPKVVPGVDCYLPKDEWEGDYYVTFGKDIYDEEIKPICL